MRICFVTAHTGTQHHTMMRAVGMAPVLAAAGHAVTVIAEDHPDNRQLLERLEGVDCQYVARSTAIADIRAKASRLSGGRFEVIHSCGLDLRTYVPRQTRRGAFWVVDHVERLSSLGAMGAHKRLFWRWAERQSLFEADGTIAASRYLEIAFRATLFGKGKNRPVLWLPYAVPQSLIAEIEAYQRKQPPRAEKTMLYAGGFYRGYGVHEIVEALQLLGARDSAWRFLFLGQGPEKQAIIASVRKAGLSDKVTIAGYLPMPEYIRTLANADVLVSPMHDTEADWARCPSKLYFYVATRRPIVTAAIGENLEVLGDTGYYYRPGDPHSLADAFARAMADSRRAASASNCVAPERHTWEHRCDRYMNWLQAAMG